MRRLEALDGLRGYFLVFMVLNHLVFTGGYLLVKVNHQELGFVQDAQGFVFLSGLLVGMVYAGQMKKRGYETGAAKVRGRARELYGWELFCLAAILGLGLLMSESSTFWEPWLWQLADNNLSFVLATATLLYQPTYMDILPQYIVYMLVAPPLVWLCVTGRWHVVAIGSFLSWMAVQFGAHLPLADAVDRGMKMLDPELALRAHFNVFAWQAVFMSGLVFGALTTTRQIDWDKVMNPRSTGLLWCAIGIVVFFMAWRLGRSFDVLPESVVERIAATEIRGEFSLLFLLNFAGAAYLVGWLMIAGPRSEHPVPRWIGEALHRLFTLSFLRLIGRHSLHVYVFHVLLIYLLKGFDHHYGAFSELTKTVIALLAVASLALPALWREWRANRERTAVPSQARTA